MLDGEIPQNADFSEDFVRTVQRQTLTCIMCSERSHHGLSDSQKISKNGCKLTSGQRLAGDSVAGE